MPSVSLDIREGGGRRLNVLKLSREENKPLKRMTSYQPEPVIIIFCENQLSARHFNSLSLILMVTKQVGVIITQS